MLGSRELYLIYFCSEYFLVKIQYGEERSLSEREDSLTSLTWLSRCSLLLSLLFVFTDGCFDTGFEMYASLKLHSIVFIAISSISLVNTKGRFAITGAHSSSSSCVGSLLDLRRHMEVDCMVSSLGLIKSLLISCRYLHASTLAFSLWWSWGLMDTFFFSMALGLITTWWMACFGLANGLGRLLVDDILLMWKLWRVVHEVCV